MLTHDAIVAASRVVADQLTATPALHHPLLDRAVAEQVAGAPEVRVVVKHEQALPTGSFKVRGGVHLASRLTAAEARHGLVTASTGNHAQSIAYAGRLADVRVCVVMPRDAPACKADAVAAIGAEVVRHGAHLGEAAAHARQHAVATGATYVDPTDPRVVLGHATAYEELFTTEAPDVVYVPIGSGTGAAGACVVRDRRRPSCRIVGVQSSAAPAGWRSWRSGSIVTAPSSTRASGLATTTGYPATQTVLSRGLDDFLLVSDEQLEHAARLLATRAHTLVELAGAASLAGLLADRAGATATVAVMATGANASVEEIARLGAA